jgi:hypothetical protein
LKTQYMKEFNPWVSWEELKSRFEHMKRISLPTARHDWINLRVQDHPTIAAYNIELFQITSQLAVCGHPIPDSELIEKTLSTFHATAHWVQICTLGLNQLTGCGTLLLFSSLCVSIHHWDTAQDLYSINHATFGAGKFTTVPQSLGQLLCLWSQQH